MKEEEGEEEAKELGMRGRGRVCREGRSKVERSVWGDDSDDQGPEGQ